MTTFRVLNKASGEEVYRYEHDTPVEFVGYEFATHDHIAMIDDQPALPVGRVMSKLAYLRLFTQEERIAIRAAAAGSAELTDYLELLNLAEDVNTSDPDTRSAVQMLEAVGLLAPGRAVEILGGV